MRHDEDVRARAEQAFQQRSLAKLADGITDPQLRTRARGVASGAISAAEFLRHMENSADAMRGFDRYLTRFMSWGPADLERIATQREQRIGEIAAELLAEQTGTRRAADVPIEQDDPSWEDQSWLE